MSLLTDRSLSEIKARLDGCFSKSSFERVVLFFAFAARTSSIRGSDPHQFSITNQDV